MNTWPLLSYLVFTPWAFFYVAIAVIEFVDRDESAKGLDSGPVQKRVEEEAPAAA